MAGIANYQEGGPSERYPARELASSMKNLADSVKVSHYVKVSDFVQTCRLLAIITSFGQQFQFIYDELNSKVKCVERGPNDPNETIQDLFDKEIAEGSAKISYSRSRNVIRMKRTLDFVRIMFEKILTNEKSESLYHPVCMAYDEIFGPYHFPSAKDAIRAAIQQFLPPTSTFVNVMNENENSIKESFHTFIESEKVVTSHIESIFQSTELGEDLLALI